MSKLQRRPTSVTRHPKTKNQEKPTRENPTKKNMQGAGSMFFAFITDAFEAVGKVGRAIGAEVGRAGASAYGAAALAAAAGHEVIGNHRGAQKLRAEAKQAPDKWAEVGGNVGEIAAKIGVVKVLAAKMAAGGAVVAVKAAGVVAGKIIGASIPFAGSGRCPCGCGEFDANPMNNDYCSCGHHWDRHF